MKLSTIHEDDKLKLVLRRIFGKKYFGRPIAHRPEKTPNITGYDTSARGLGGTGNFLSRGVPVNPRHRRYFGIRPG